MTAGAERLLVPRVSRAELVAEFARFDGGAMVAIRRELVGAIDAGEGPRLEAEIQAHQPPARPNRLAMGRRAAANNRLPAARDQ